MPTEKLAGVQDVRMVPRPCLDAPSLGAWEQRHGAPLPAALKELYAATDGLSVTWNLCVTGGDGQ